eukprot:COSAG02_NODE_167_length_31944_cov_19.552237_5_plen_225_part_00
MCGPARAISPAFIACPPIFPQLPHHPARICGNKSILKIWALCLVRCSVIGVLTGMWGARARARLTLASTSLARPRACACARALPALSVSRRHAGLRRVGLTSLSDRLACLSLIASPVRHARRRATTRAADLLQQLPGSKGDRLSILRRYPLGSHDGLLSRWTASPWTQRSSQSTVLPMRSGPSSTAMGTCIHTYACIYIHTCPAELCRSRTSQFSQSTVPKQTC